MSGPHNKSPEDYRWLAEQCRELARSVSVGNGRTDLLARAEMWERIADHFSLWVKFKGPNPRIDGPIIRAGRYSRTQT